MRSGAAAGTSGYFHETALYGDDNELLDVVVPFLQGGLDAGEPTVVTFAERNTNLVRAVMGPDSGVRFLPGADQYARPATAIRTYQDMFAAFVAEGAAQIRVVGDVPHPGTGGSWRDWVRYEAIINHAYDAYPLWGLCPYDTRTTPAEVIDDVLATHPHIAHGTHHAPNRSFDRHHRVLERLPDATPFDLEATAPDVVLKNPSARHARHVVQAYAERAGLGEDDQQAVVVTVSEFVTNALVHGAAPHRLELWSEPGQVVLAVTDAGHGTTDPCAGLTKAPRTDGGMGLWLAHQLCTDVALRHHQDGFTASAVVGRRD